MIERKFLCNRTSQAFMQDRESDVKMLMGPVGAGKSSTCCITIYESAMNMPEGYDGIKRARWAILRSTYSQLKTTTVRTWQEWFPPEVFGPVKGDSPMTHVIKQPGLLLEVIFLALDSIADLERLKSLELTGAYLNEAQFIGSEEILSTVRERTDRYPGTIFGGSLKKDVVIMDANPPSQRHWIYRKFEVEKPKGFAIYHMPPAIIQDEEGNWHNNPDADYICQHPNPNYWLNKVSGASKTYVQISLEGKYGIMVEGKPVHPDYNDRLHYSNQQLICNPSVEIGLGWDFGLTPACAVVQLSPDGQLHVLHEFTSTHSGLRQFCENIVIPQLDKKFPSWRNNYRSIHDPAGEAGSQADQKSCADIFRELGIISIPCVSNSPTLRRDALDFFLTRLVGGAPGLLLSDRAQIIREGLMGEFHYPLIKSSSLSDTKEFEPKPKKNFHSHICEALEYICTAYARTAKEPASNSTEKPYTIHHGSAFGR